MADVGSDETTYSANSYDGEESDLEVVTSKAGSANFSDDSSSEGYEDADKGDEIEKTECEGRKEESDSATGGNDDDDDDDDDGDDDANEEAYKRYEERSSFNYARIEVDEDYEDDLGFPMYYAGYTHRKKQLPIGMDCWKVKNIPADPKLLREMIQDQKARRDLLGKVMEEVAKEKSRLTELLAAQ